jgi:dTDP-4-dehydrorhamnose reductase
MLFNRTLITGANGMLGQSLVRLLSRYPEYDVLATGRDETARFQGGSGGYVPMDICDYDAVRAVFSDFTPGVVINCAAMTAVDACEEDREACWRANVDAVEHLAKCCLAGGSRLIQISTDFVFDGDSGPYRETDRPNPVNFYGKSKLAAENFVRGAGLDRWAIVRTVLVYGTGENLGRHNIALWVAGKLSSGETIRVVTDQHRTPTFVDDLANGVERVVRFGKSGVFHVSGREMMSIYDFATSVADVFGLDATLIERADSRSFTQPAPRPPKTGFIILKAETEIGYKPRTVMEALTTLRQQVETSIATEE